ncbi:MAG: hypothetical protein HY788_24155 [Deltaproteobacteria bacterium]|nr:hypothetical protein [Deltaproteobacteria bacterium]
MSSHTDSNNPVSGHAAKGCAEYRLAMELTALRRRLQTEILDADATRALERRVREIEKALGV